MTDFSLEIKHIHKSYKKVHALSDISLSLTNGIYALLGPNGSGKSTLISIITQNLKQDHGEVFCNGENIQKMGKRYRAILGYVPQSSGVIPSFSLNEFLMYIADLKGLNREASSKQIPELINLVDLEEFQDRKLGTFSEGMKRRALFAQSLLGNPSVLILDEPTAGLDPIQRTNLKNSLMHFSEDKCILFATHLIPDIEELASYLVFLKKGRITAEGKPEKIKELLLNCFWDVPESSIMVEGNSNEYRIVKYYHKENKQLARVISPTRPCEEAVPVIPDINDCYHYYFERLELDE